MERACCVQAADWLDGKLLWCDHDLHYNFIPLSKRVHLFCTMILTWTGHFHFWINMENESGNDLSDWKTNPSVPV